MSLTTVDVVNRLYGGMEEFRDAHKDLADTAIADAIADATTVYSSVRPRRIVEDLVLTGVSRAPLPTDWDDHWSVVTSIEYPIGNHPITYLNSDGFQLLQEPGGWVIYFHAYDIGVGQTVRARHTALHQSCGPLPLTIPDADHGIVALLAAARVANQIAGKMGDAINPGVADLADTATQADRWRSHSRRLQMEADGMLARYRPRAVSTMAVRI